MSSIQSNFSGIYSILRENSVQSYQGLNLNENQKENKRNKIKCIVLTSLVVVLAVACTTLIVLLSLSIESK